MAIPLVGVFLPSTSRADSPPGETAAAAQLAERSGFESVWVPDQLVLRTAQTHLDSTMVLAAASAVTQRVKLGFGVMILALRHPLWAAKQIATLQQLSGDRVILGVGVGEARHPQSWGIAGVPRSHRGRLTDQALDALPSLITGQLNYGSDGTPFRLLPGATMPKLTIGGVSDSALARAVRFGGWFSPPLPPEDLARARDRLARMAADQDLPAPRITTLVTAAISGDPKVGDRQSVLDAISDPGGVWDFPAEHAAKILTTGTPAEVADHLRALGEAGADRVVVNPAVGHWRSQYALLARARDLLGSPTTAP